MRIPRQFIVVVSATVVSLCCLATEVGAQPVPFQANFGVDQPITPKGGTTDEGRFLTESMNGDIIVAGYGASYYTDAANLVEENPMLARFDRSGQMRWQRIHTDLSQYRIMALFSDQNGDFIVLEDIRLLFGRDSFPYYDVELRRIGDDGDLSEVVSRINVAYGSDSFEYWDQGSSGVMFPAVTVPGLSARVAGREEKTLVGMLSDGTIQTRSRPDEYWPTQYLGDGEMLVRQFIRPVPNDDAGENGVAGRDAQSIAIGGFSGNASEIIYIETEEPYSSSINIFATPRAIFLLREYWIRDWIAQRRGAVSAYSPSGVLLTETDPFSGERLSHPTATPDGGFVAVGRDPSDGQALLFEFSPNGDLLWRSGLSTQHDNIRLHDAIVLSDGWLAVTGSPFAGSWNSETHRWEHGDSWLFGPFERDAFLFVSPRSPAGLASASN